MQLDEAGLAVVVTGGVGVAIAGIAPRWGVLVLGAAYAAERCRGFLSARTGMLCVASFWLTSARPVVDAAIAAMAVGAARWVAGNEERAFGEVVAVGSKNPSKVAAVRTAIRAYGGASVRAVAAASGVPEQPMGLEVTARGARNRAEGAFYAGPTRPSLAFGIESGLFGLGGGGLYDVCVVSAFDGRRHALGLSCAFEIPPEVRRAVVEDGLNLSDAANKAGIATDPNVGQRGGLVSILTRGRVTRAQYTIQAIQMALAQYDHPTWYSDDER
ncbi:hypothetical protein CTAYLR_000459 [Chrysophaeum taylorii]|uniref:inosine/xanthosine triphosphatase n=1 Tax=Chrysophaeum taylorii TaxID=2483200 RepID=A0AAD7UGQ2_9STRA|nr:hypothetical protein CTAYLR_000459 [Chrysophaeum taylorii]